MRWQGQISRLMVLTMVFPIIVVDIDHSPSMMLFRHCQGTLRGCDDIVCPTTCAYPTLFKEQAGYRAGVG